MEFVRKISVKLFYKPFERMGIRPNQLTILNFLTNSLTAVVFFAKGFPRLGLLFCIMGGMIDYIDGELARRKFGGNTEKGKWLIPVSALLIAIGILTRPALILVPLLIFSAVLLFNKKSVQFHKPKIIIKQGIVLYLLILIFLLLWQT